ncbi:transglutaminase family protein [uncultured Methanobrevibacter sp.]|uniref:transglutaminase-like domain-containing protein n=1 Tax=uncultured Methanobrevibacter sp. TaxID=253161 RepID=UPI0025F875B3|nr:Ig-like domain repeat protein [uncultured Methanobrevibacter sp.]
MTFFILLGAVSAVDTTNVSITEYSNLEDNVDSLSVQNKLEISNEDSISETNIVNSHDDNLEDYPSDSVLSSSLNSDYEDNNGTLGASFLKVSADENSSSVSNNDILSVSEDDSVVSVSSQNSEILGAASKVATKLSVSDTTYSKSGTVFKVTLKDNAGKALYNQKVLLKVNGKLFSAVTNKNGIASIKANALAIGFYTISLTYAGNSNYSASSLSKKVKVLSSVKGSDLTKYYGYTSVYQATFLRDGGALANTKVSYSIDGKTYTKSTDKNGVLKVSVYLDVGTHTITSTNPYSKEKLSNKVVVKRDYSTLTHSPEKIYISPKTSYVFTVVLKSKHNVDLKQGVIYFTYNNKTVTATTDEDGKASIKIPGLSKGTYKINYQFQGTSMFYASSGISYLYVTDSACSISSSVLKMSYNDGSKFSATLKKSNKPLSGKVIKFYLNGKTYAAKTNSKGVAQFTVGNLKPGTYAVKYSYSTLGSKYYAEGSNKIIVSKLAAVVNAKHLVMKYNDGSSYKVTVKDKSGKLLKNMLVKFTINGKSYMRKTDDKGVAKIAILLKVGLYQIKTISANAYYQSEPVTMKVLVNGTKFIANQLYVSVGKSVSYSIKAIDGLNHTIKKAKVTFTVDKKNYHVITNNYGIAKVNLGKLSKGDHKIRFALQSTVGTSTIHVVNKVTLKQIIAASKYVKNYIEDNEKLPSKIKIGSLYYSNADFLYLVSKAIINLKSGSKADISVLKVSKPVKAGAAVNKNDLYDYLSVAKSLVKTAESKGVMPNSVSSKVGSIGYNGIVYALARVVAFYGDNNIMPAYTAIKSLSESTTSKLNSKNTISNLAPYLAASANCQVNNAKIKNLATKLTKSLTSDKAKARAIFNYVRDTISYSFYYDTRYGAVGTLNAGTGNCVDHAHLVVALSRAAGLPARYVHGTCTFSSATYGHVWAQVLIGNTWTVCDATSTRNSLGNVVNWNANTYSLHGYYVSLDF